jgi:L-threonylcarbamoyladenylate synthase
LGADARNGEAVAAIFAAKERPRFNPLIVHDHQERVERHAHFNQLALKLAEKFWPGPLTLVLPRRSESDLSLLVSAGLDTVALRVPAHPIARALLSEFAGPVAAPSANLSGRITSTTAAAAATELEGRVALVLDGGSAPLGIESTIVGFADNKAVLLRPGSIARAEVEAVVGPLAKHGKGLVTAPGQLESHYAPRARLRLNAPEAGPDEVLITFGPRIPASAKRAYNLSERGDLREAAANLFAVLRAVDSSGVRAIAVMPIPSEGLGEAINDRLARAAAPRDKP